MSARLDPASGAIGSSRQIPGVTVKVGAVEPEALGASEETALRLTEVHAEDVAPVLPDRTKVDHADNRASDG